MSASISAFRRVLSVSALSPNSEVGRKKRKKTQSGQGFSSLRLELFHDSQSSPHSLLFASLCVSCGYTISEFGLRSGWLQLHGYGCISTRETVYRETARLKVEFENDAAARSFYEAFNRSPESRQRTEKRVSLHIPVVFSHSRAEIEPPDAGFNAAVRRCDTNGDGRLTEQEARIFAGQTAGNK